MHSRIARDGMCISPITSSVSHRTKRRDAGQRAVQRTAEAVAGRTAVAVAAPRQTVGNKVSDDASLHDDNHNRDGHDVRHGDPVGNDIRHGVRHTRAHDRSGRRPERYR